MMSEASPTLSTYVEQISDEFQSTFSVVDANVLVNMMSPSDFGTIETIVRKYIPGANLEFLKLSGMRGMYNIYFVRLRKMEEKP
jgi:hypothetical protein